MSFKHTRPGVGPQLPLQPVFLAPKRILTGSIRQDAAETGHGGFPAYAGGSVVGSVFPRINEMQLSDHGDVPAVWGAHSSQLGHEGLGRLRLAGEKGG